MFYTVLPHTFKVAIRGPQAGAVLSPQDKWQCLQTFLVVMTGLGGATGI